MNETLRYVAAAIVVATVGITLTCVLYLAYQALIVTLWFVLC